MKHNPIKTFFSYFFLIIGFTGACSDIVKHSAPDQKDIFFALLFVALGIALSYRKSLIGLISFLSLFSIAVLFGSSEFYVMIKTNVGRTIYLIVLYLGAIIGSEVIYLWNRLQKADENINKQLSNLNILYQKKIDLIPNVMSQNDQFQNHEKSIFIELGKIRAGLNSGLNQDTISQIKEFREAEMLLGQARITLEAYPLLTSAENVKILMLEIAKIEFEIEKERKLYNVTVESLNTALRAFPIFLFKNWLHVASRPYFEKEYAR